MTKKNLQSDKRRHCVVLGAGAPHYGQNPSLLEPVNGVPVLDWLTKAFPLSDYQIDLVLGYKSEFISKNYPEIETFVNADWKSTGSVASLLKVDLDEIDELVVCYGDILIRKTLVERLLACPGDVVIAWDSQWQHRYIARDQKDICESEKVIVNEHKVQRTGRDIPQSWASGEFIGLVKFGGTALNKLKRIKAEASAEIVNLYLSNLIEKYRIDGFSINEVDVCGDWAEVNNPQDIARFVLGTKAETLERLRSVITVANIQEQVSFTTNQWQQDKESVLTEIRSKFGKKKLIVRSSAKGEDGFEGSFAGAFKSVLDVDSHIGLEEAVNDVIRSYCNPQPGHQVLIQPMIEDVALSGVVFTRTLEHSAPWYVINYDETGRTDAITSGANNLYKTLYVRRDASDDDITDQRMRPVIESIKEIENLVSYDALDIEFAVDKSGQVHILQVRPITVTPPNNFDVNEAVFERMFEAEKQWLNRAEPLPHILGQQPIYGIMPDWNPAEIIGVNPTPLAQSLYEYLILNETWAIQRAEYGYRDVRPLPLLVTFAGKPYVDVRASFNSFIPADVSDELAEKLVNAYSKKLIENPHYHDKIEFYVVPTCMGPEFSRWGDWLRTDVGMTEEEIDAFAEGLRQITLAGIERTGADLEQVRKLEKRFYKVQDRIPENDKSSATWIRSLLDDCRLNGTLPFAHLARSAFIAVTMLREGVSVGVISQKAMDEFLASVRTVSHELGTDAQKVNSKEMLWREFVEKYGHLRPGTYDITSPSYARSPNKYLKPIVDKTSAVVAEDNIDTGTWDNEKVALFELLRSLNLKVDDNDFEGFLRTSIAGREEAKFIFTRSLSKALDLIEAWGTQNNLSLTEIASLSIQTIFDLTESHSSASGINDYTMNMIRLKEHERSVSAACALPPLLYSSKHFYSFELSGSEPNFIGSQSVIANTLVLTSSKLEGNIDFSGMIILIPHADPGFDWLFSSNIAGLITMYGGANSHIAIRAAEFNLPAAVGVGEELYKSLIKHNKIALDPRNKKVQGIL